MLLHTALRKPLLYDLLSRRDAWAGISLSLSSPPLPPLSLSLQVGEGVKIEPPKQPAFASDPLFAAERTHAGKTDGKVSASEASRITKNIGMPVPKGWSLSTAPPATFVTEAMSQYHYQAPTKDPFLSKLAAVEANEPKTSPSKARMSLIPRVA